MGAYIISKYSSDSKSLLWYTNDKNYLLKDVFSIPFSYLFKSFSHLCYTTSKWYMNTRCPLFIRIEVTFFNVFLTRLLVVVSYMME